VVSYNGGVFVRIIVNNEFADLMKVRGYKNWLEASNKIFHQTMP